MKKYMTPELSEVLVLEDVLSDSAFDNIDDTIGTIPNPGDEESDSFEIIAD